MRNIRKATINDFKAILAVRQGQELDKSSINDPKYTRELLKTGFLIDEYTEEEFKNDLNNIFLVYEEDGDLKGYIRIESEFQYKDNELKHWNDFSMKKEYYSSPHAEIGTIAIEKNAQGMGIASKLLLEVEKELKKEKRNFLFSIVTVSPVKNRPSLNFHKKNDFKIVCEADPTELFGMKDYSSVLLVKRLF